MDIEHVIHDVFVGLTNKIPTPEEMGEWKSNIKDNPHSLTQLVFKLQHSVDGVKNIQKTHYELLLRTIYGKIRSHSEPCDPFTIIQSKYLLAYMHIPKTAGRAVSTMFAKNIHPLELQAARYHDFDIERSTKLFIGHYTYNNVPKNNENMILITALRDPRSRIFSLYNFLQKVPDKIQYFGKAGAAARANSFYDFVRVRDPEVSWVFENHYARVLSGQGVPGNMLTRPLKNSDVQLALENLKNFSHIIIQEHMASSGALPDSLVDDLDARMGFDVRGEVQKVKVSHPDTAFEIGDIPDSVCEMDYRIYEAALERAIK